jgi:hypothetical protein
MLQVTRCLDMDTRTFGPLKHDDAFLPMISADRKLSFCGLRSLQNE